MAWRRTGDKPLPESMLTRFAYAYMRHQGHMTKMTGNFWWCNQLLVSIVATDVLEMNSRSPTSTILMQQLLCGTNRIRRTLLLIYCYNYGFFVALLELKTTLATDENAPWHLAFSYTVLTHTCPFMQKINLGKQRNQSSFSIFHIRAREVSTSGRTIIYVDSSFIGFDSF